MDAWIDLRRKARECHAKALTKANGVRAGEKLVAAAFENDDLDLRRYEPGTIVSKGVLGFLDRIPKLVNVAKYQDPADELVVIAHEIGHFWLHHDSRNEVTVTASGLGGDVIDSGAGRVEGYSPRERKEVQADIFAGEFLCPSDWVREEYIKSGKRPADIAAELGLPLHLVMNQTIRALLLPPLRPSAPDLASIDHELDDSQKVAVTWDKGPLLVNAGPGTGKTRTLIRRTKHLLDNDAHPSSILALTFSNKAADEIRERLSAMNADAAVELWAGTFHAFGFELVTKWPSSVGRTAKVRILDQTGSFALLEENLTRLPLRHYQNLYEPAYELVHVLRAISRCKDELISPEVYRLEADAAMAAATTDDEREAAEKAQEVAAIYRIYEDALRDADAVDFGDLVLLATKLVESNPDVQKYIAGFEHVLVDEYQDVNLASARLLKAIRAAGADIWVVADQRQSIYRFRGAEPSNVSRFQKEFGGTHHSLANNYRSFAPVVRIFEKFSSSMSGGTMAGSWAANRGAGGAVTLTVAPTLAAEGEAIRAKIEELRVKGIPYGDQVILGRSHLTLARVTGILEQLGVPLLYLGDLFERSEIRDLLSLVGIDAEFGGVGLVRMATLPAYGATRDDALVVIRWAQANRVQIFEALSRLPEIEGISDVGRVGLAALAAEVQGLSNVSPWTLLTSWLFERSDYLRPLVIANDAVAQQKLVAIYQLLKVCGEHISLGDTSRKRFLERVRRIEALNDDSRYRAVASEAADMDAVRVMTIHGSKGLEFGAVHFPALATRYMPTGRQWARCPPPPSLTQLAMQPQDHDAEEECLFFVGMSRARDYLCLSRAERYTSQNASPSKFLNSVTTMVQATRYPGSGITLSSEIQLRPPGARDSYPERELTTYMHCPARYQYEAIDWLHGARDESAYIRFHRCVYITIGWLEQERESGRTADNLSAMAHLDADWQVSGPVGHAFEGYYRAAAEGMVKGMVQAIASESGQYERREWLVPVGASQVAITPDRVLKTPDGAVHVQRIRTGRETKSEADNPIYALLRRGAAIQYPGMKVSVETFYLATGARVPVLPKGDDKNIKAYADAILAIERGDFHPTPDPRRCPNCQCYFMCGA